MRTAGGRSLAIAVLIIELALIAGGAVLAALQHQLTFDDYILPGTVGLGFIAVGALVAHRRPGQMMGWLMLAVGGFWQLSITASGYATLDYHQHGGRLPLGWLAALCIPAWATAFVVLAAAVVVFPDGHPPSPAWRWPLRVLGLLSALWVLTTLVVVIPLLLDGTIRISADGDIAQLQGKTSASAVIYGVLLVLIGLTSALTIIVWLLSQFVSFRRLRGQRRTQQKWILAGVATSFMAIALSFALNSNSTLADVLALGIVAMPVTMGVAVLRYRLYEIDRIISRTLSYAILTALLVGAFVGLVELMTQLLPFSSTVGVAGSTLAAAAMFNPLRVRVQRRVDRRFDRARYDAEETVNAFAARLRDAVELESVQRDLLSAVDGAVAPAHATVWIRPTHHSTRLQTPG